MSMVKSVVGPSLFVSVWCLWGAGLLWSKLVFDDTGFWSYPVGTVRGVYLGYDVLSLF